MTPIPLTPTAPVTLEKAEEWLRDCAEGVWTAPKFASLYGPLLLEVYAKQAEDLTEAHRRIECLAAHSREANQRVTETLGVRYTIAEAAADLVEAHQDAPLLGYRRHVARYVTALAAALRAPAAGQ